MCESCAVLAERRPFSEIGCAESKESGLGERGAGKCGSFTGQSKLRIHPEMIILRGDVQEINIVAREVVWDDIHIERKSVGCRGKRDESDSHDESIGSAPDDCLYL